jgi:hypothetical protein
MDFLEELRKLLGAKVTDETLFKDLEEGIDKLYVESVGSLKQNRDDLKKEKLEIKAKYDQLQAQIKDYDNLTPAEVKQLKKDIEELRANPGDAAKLKQLEEAYKTQVKQAEIDKQEAIKSMTEELEQFKTRYSQLDNELNQDKALRELGVHLTSVGVETKHMPLITAALAGRVFVEIVDGIRSVKYRNEAGAVFPIKDGIELWAKQDVNKQYLASPSNRGSGAGGSGAATSKLLGMKFSEMSPEQQSELYKINPELWKQKRAEALE